MIEYLIANLPMLLCVILGAGLIIVEVFLPGFGLPGISGIALIGAGVLIAAMNHGALTAVGMLLIVIAVLAVLISWVLRSATRGEMANSDLFLKDKDELNPREDMKVLVGRAGVTASVLRPAGIGDFDGVRLNVVTEGGFIEKDRRIEIVSVEGTKIVVRAVQED